MLANDSTDYWIENVRKGRGEKEGGGGGKEKMEGVNSSFRHYCEGI